MRAFLSPTMIDMYRQCRRCAYDQYAMQLKRPRGIYPTLPNGIDAVLKKYTDGFRGSLPPQLSHLEGHIVHPEQSLLNTLREWNGLKVVYEVMVDRPTQGNPKRRVNHTLIVNGGIDELLLNSTGEVVLCDFKTKDKEPPDDYADKYYKDTMDTYTWMLKQNGFKVADYGYLFYWWPKSVQADGSIQFACKTLHMQLSADNTEKKLDEIGNSMPTISMEALQYRPKADSGCQYCEYIEKHEVIAQS